MVLNLKLLFAVWDKWNDKLSSGMVTIALDVVACDADHLWACRQPSDCNSAGGVWQGTSSSLAASALDRTQTDSAIAYCVAPHDCKNSAVPVDNWVTHCANFWGCSGNSAVKGNYVCMGASYYDISGGSITAYACADDAFLDCAQTGSWPAEEGEGSNGERVYRVVSWQPEPPNGGWKWLRFDE